MAVPGGCEDEFADDSEPASDRHLNVPQGEPRLRLLRGGVWW
jgi:heat shock protein HtpX